jgi:tRNA 2-thiouridine synthesizing protein A
LNTPVAGAAYSKGTLLKEHWDAGETGCAQLVFELRLRLNRIDPGQQIEVIARDPGAPTDLPAWCRMTGHTLLSANHPVYVIQRKSD